jgi:hypothetical protein
MMKRGEVQESKGEGDLRQREVWCVEACHGQEDEDGAHRRDQTLEVGTQLWVLEFAYEFTKKALYQS